MNTIYKQFKIQPVLAFYRLLGKSFLFIIGVSLVLATFDALLFWFGFTKALGNTGVQELTEIIKNQATNTKEMIAQSKVMEGYILNHPAIVPMILFSLFISVLTIAYSFYAIHQFIKNDLFNVKHHFFKTLIPNTGFIKIILYLILLFGVFTFAGGFVILSISANPILGAIVALFLLIFLIRTSLFIPGVITGEMDFIEALKYSIQTISIGRAFKILIFGFIVFSMLSFLLSALFYYPSLWIHNRLGIFYIQLLELFILNGLISVGLSSLFIRYGNFEEENIAE